MVHAGALSTQVEPARDGAQRTTETERQTTSELLEASDCGLHAWGRLHLCYGVLKTGRPFDPNYALSS